MSLCSKTLKTHKFELEVFSSGDVAERCIDCKKLFYHFKSSIKNIDLRNKEVDE